MAAVVVVGVVVVVVSGSAAFGDVSVAEAAAFGDNSEDSCVVVVCREEAEGEGEVEDVSAGSVGCVAGSDVSADSARGSIGAVSSSSFSASSCSCVGVCGGVSDTEPMDVSISAVLCSSAVSRGWMGGGVRTSDIVLGSADIVDRMAESQLTRRLEARRCSITHRHTHRRSVKAGTERAGSVWEAGR